MAYGGYTLIGTFATGQARVLFFNSPTQPVGSFYSGYTKLHYKDPQSPSGWPVGLINK